MTVLAAMTCRTRFLAAAFLVACVTACDSTPVHRLAPLEPKDCPPDPSPVALGGGFYRVDSTKQRYTDIIIDGVVVLRNVPSNSKAPLAIPGFPRQEDIKRIWDATWYMSSAEIRRKYGTCPGMGVWLYETKAGNWHPVDAGAPAPSEPTAPGRIAP